jgi:MFS family permease
LPAHRYERDTRALACAAVRWIVLCCIALAAISVAFVSTPTYDPWAWLVWGREVAHLDLSTVSGPSWKPLPVLFTTAFSVFSDFAPTLWLIVARAGGLLAMVLAFRLGRRLAGTVAGVVAAVAVVLSAGWFSQITGGLSEELLIALILWAWLCHLDKKPGQALLLGFLASLLRPEVWPFLFVYIVYLWIKYPHLRPLCLVVPPAVALLWLGPEWWGSGSPLRASSRAIAGTSSETASGIQALPQVASRAWEQVILPVKLLALVGFLFAVFRKQKAVLALVAAAVAWVAVVAVMAFSGYPGLARFMIPAAGIACVVAGVGASRLVGVAGRRWSMAALLVLCVVAIPLAVPRLSQIPHHLSVESAADRARDMSQAVASAGGPGQILRCGRAYTSPESVPALAWQLGIHTKQVGLEPKAPGVVFRPLGGPLPQTPAPPFRPVAVGGNWQVLAACP